MAPVNGWDTDDVLTLLGSAMPPKRLEYDDRDARVPLMDLDGKFRMYQWVLSCGILPPDPARYVSIRRPRWGRNQFRGRL